MRIGIYDPYLDDLGGGEKYMMMIAQCLSEAHEVSVFWDHKEDFEKLTARFDLDLSQVKLVKNIFSPRVSLKNRLLETRKYDALIVMSDGSIPVTLSKNLFLHIQQPLDYFQSASIFGKIKMSRVKKIFVNSNFTKQFVDKRFGLDVSIVYPPVFLYPKDVKKENIILHVGRFRVKNVRGVDDYKKQHVMIRAFKEMVDNGLKNWTFVLAVSFPEDQNDQFEKMKKETEDYPIEFEINKSNKQLWDIYSKAKIYWHASGYGEDLEKHPEFAEHFGISTVEAMGAGAVPVVINAGGQREIVEDGKNGFTWDTLDALQEKTRALIHDQKLLEQLSVEAKKRADYFAGDRFCQEVKALIET